MFGLSRGRAPKGGRPPETEAGPAQLLPDLELSDEALEHVVGGLERVYIFGSEAEPATEPA
jgi:hypothetical protein